MERGDGLPHGRRPAFVLLVLAHEELERGVARALGDLVDAAARAVGGARVEAVLQRAPHGLDVAGPGGGEDALALGGVHGGFERAPAGEAVVTGDQALGVGELGGGILAAQRTQTPLGLFAEVLEIHGGPSFPSAGHGPAVRPVSASVGQEVRFVRVRRRASGLSPLRGPWAPRRAGRHGTSPPGPPQPEGPRSGLAPSHPLRR